MITDRIGLHSVLLPLLIEVLTNFQNMARFSNYLRKSTFAFSLAKNSRTISVNVLEQEVKLISSGRKKQIFDTIYAYFCNRIRTCCSVTRPVRCDYLLIRIVCVYL